MPMALVSCGSCGRQWKGKASDIGAPAGSESSFCAVARIVMWHTVLHTIYLLHSAASFLTNPSHASVLDGRAHVSQQTR